MTIVAAMNVLRTTKIAFNQPWSGRHIWVTIAKNGHILPIYRLVKSILAQRVEMIEEWNMDRLDVSYRVFILEMDYFSRLEMTGKPNILICIDDLHIAKGWTFWYVCLLLTKKINMGSLLDFFKKLEKLKFFSIFS